MTLRVIPSELGFQEAEWVYPQSLRGEECCISFWKNYSTC